MGWQTGQNRLVEMINDYATGGLKRNVGHSNFQPRRKIEMNSKVFRLK